MMYQPILKIFYLYPKGHQIFRLYPKDTSQFSPDIHQFKNECNEVISSTVNTALKFSLVNKMETQTESQIR